MQVFQKKYFLNKRGKYSSNYYAFQNDLIEYFHVTADVLFSSVYEERRTSLQLAGAIFSFASKLPAEKE
jgi:hypothetical protein